MKAYVGFNFTPTEVDHLPFYDIKTSHKHPEYNMEDRWGQADIGLIQLDKPINTSANRPEFAVEISICLPKTGIKEERDEYVMMFGWGNTHKARMPLPIGYRVIKAKGWFEPKQFLHKSPDNSTKLCVVSLYTQFN